MRPPFRILNRKPGSASRVRIKQRYLDLGITGLYLMRDPLFRNEVNNAYPTIAASGVSLSTFGEYGVAITTAAGAEALHIGLGDGQINLHGADDFTFITKAFVDTNTGGVEQTLFGTYPDMLIRQDGLSNNIDFYTREDGSTYAYVCPTTMQTWYRIGWQLYETHTLGIRWSNTYGNITWFEDGVNHGTNGTPSGSLDLDGINLTIGSRYGYPADTWRGNIFFTAIFRGYLPDSVLEKVTREGHPGEFLETQRIWVPVSAVTAPTGTGTITLGISTLAAQAVMEPSGSGVLDLDDIILNASGSSVLEPTGSGVLSLDEAILLASGLQEIPGTAALTLSDIVLAASGAQDIPGTAAVSLSEVLVDAQGAQEYIATAAPILSTTVLDADGNAAVAPDGTGTLVLDSTTLSGTGVQSIPGTGTVLLETVVLNASGFSGAPEGTGTLVLDQTALDAQAVMLPDGSAAIVLDLVVLAAQGLGPAPEVTGGPWIIYARRRGRR